ncbi:MAG: glycosyltransferase [Opitutaceae bacterium]|nr:glycosyltransferase [Opitutaceae bacterium]
MIWFDCTKAAQTAHHSGLQRVSTRLMAELGEDATAVASWNWLGAAVRRDWWLTAEVFAPDERPGWNEVAQRRPCRLAAIFHDAIPLKFPHITWPQSVARHPAYLKMLAGFDLVFAVSEASKLELAGYWAWLGLERTPPIEVLSLGADFDGAARVTAPQDETEPVLLSVGILEPRKNQAFLLEVCESLWSEGLQFELHLVGRVNPNFGRPVAQRIKQLRRKWSGLHHHARLDDAGLARLYASARAAVFPSQAEGCGLPVLEAMWRGVPCLCSDIPPIRENASAGGAVLLPTNDRIAWRDAMRACLITAPHAQRLSREAVIRPLPTWRGTAESLITSIGKL